MISALLASGIVIYFVNYAIGWLLYFKIITMTKRTHQIFFAAIIVNLVFLLFLLKFFSAEFILCLCSLATMLILPLGRKGGAYHRIISTIGFLIYITLYVSYQYYSNYQ